MASFQTTAWFNERPSADFKLMLDDPKGFLDPPGRSDQLVDIPDQIGSERVSRTGKSGARTFTIEGAQMAASKVELEALWSDFIRLVETEEVECRFSAWPDIVGRGRLTGVPVDHVSGRYVSRKFQLTFEMANPIKYARYPDFYTILHDTERPILLGNAPSHLDLHIIGRNSVGAPSVFYKNAQGLVAGDITIGIAPLAVGAWIDFSGEDLNAIRYIPVGSVAPFTWGEEAVDVSEMITTVGYPVPDPDDGDDYQGPTLTCVNCDIYAKIRKAYY